jgi:hypothetical protein
VRGRGIQYGLSFVALIAKSLCKLTCEVDPSLPSPDPRQKSATAVTATPDTKPLIPPTMPRRGTAIGLRR